MPRAKQLTLTVADRPGMLGDIATALGAKKVNIVGVCGATTGGGGMIWMVVDKTAAAKKVLGRFATKLGKAGVNITFAYTGSAGSARKQTAYLGVSDMKAALKVRP